MFPRAWLQLSLPLCSASQPTCVCTIPSAKIVSLARDSICVEINNQSKENGWKKKQYLAITFLDFLRVLFLPAVRICLQHRLSLLAWAEGSGTIQLFTVQPVAGEGLLLLGNPLLSLFVTLPRCRVRFGSPQTVLKKASDQSVAKANEGECSWCFACNWRDEVLCKQSVLAVLKRGQRVNF